MAVKAKELKNLVVFRNPSGDYFSMDPRWSDSAVRDAWKAQHSEEAAKSPKQQEKEALVATLESVGVETEDEDDEDYEPDYESWNNNDLRADLSERGLSVDGKKADLIKRLREDDEKDEA